MGVCLATSKTFELADKLLSYATKLPRLLQCFQYVFLVARGCQAAVDGARRGLRGRCRLFDVSVFPHATNCGEWLQY